MDFCPACGTKISAQMIMSSEYVSPVAYTRKKQVYTGKKRSAMFPVFMLILVLVAVMALLFYVSIPWNELSFEEIFAYARN